ncbi:MAG: Hexapeptide repeat-containing transferase [Candidatus Collierbacteria bacterium GW2011_GWB1_44_6]|uniref:Hexapeptide repeat-containing transferase n=2 Tax=Candidatus Collieribacteriota TaxID=1752725 RepID=A0A0G1LY47_9BACT|nr:MAG: Hexapeptide repeat-containing transferase [Candidatus Collierbacteria bacterium GW2011_GWC2_43_12]KKT73757.1 MAG: Hexapeptide repeat-containing transferase [Candidatus Collierbacteria bacterium GW2011_GWB1_44_6]KKT83929.1 MAG: Hexapeptide repeat-containing transferase [Microgenomates group bacterium GW2011_GWC1_44_9]
MFEKIILINEKISLFDFVFKYTLRDLFLGILRGVPSSIGVGLRMICLPPFFKKAGRGLTVREGAIFKFPERISIGNHVGISEYCVLDGDGGIEIGDYVRIAPHTSIVSFTHNYLDKNILIKKQGKERKKIIIGSDVWIGNGTTILSGTKIGDGVVIGANSVINRDVLPYTVVAGSPAKYIKKRK